MGFGRVRWWEDNMSSPDVELNNTASAQFRVQFAIDLMQLQKGDQTFNMTISPQLVSSQNSQLDTVVSTGRLEILVKQAT
jgi:hypothetical protein